MLCFRNLPRAATFLGLSLPFRSARAFSGSSMAAHPVPPQDFHLDRSIFNESLYSQLREFWFAGTPLDSSTPNFATAKRWFGIGSSPEEKLAFDQECRANFGHALLALSPERLTLPPYKSHEDDLVHAKGVAGPFIHEVQTANAEDGQRGAQTLLSLILLLDQMPRNIYRDAEGEHRCPCDGRTWLWCSTKRSLGLRLVYNHYDRLSWTLLRSSMAMTPNPSEHPSYAQKPMYLMWLILPLMHSEHLESHEMAMKFITATDARLEATGDQSLVEAWQNSRKSARQHKEIIDKYGRYPHRNECLGRTNTKDETEYLTTGETFGVKQSSSGAADTKGKDEL